MPPIPEDCAQLTDPPGVNDYDSFAEAYTAQSDTGIQNAYYERPAILALADGRVGRRPFDMQLDIPESSLGLDRAGPRRDLHEPVAHFPPRRRSLGGPPGVEARSIEQNDGILGRRL